ncbi:YcxB family protein [Phytomonospora endophytica]|uniref:YcxB-like C-terminal domain-containing protein n=1 Tax=Phytomonospora endophytica TaxID=714109 RepID=A0A841FM77_9ACTN|nr:YcxB family protein [Phytomonospora endophytica]MBB6033709.1 hypothetical protein [Phytomonospora endophytica]GIG64773.1 hypothetical protein Pen01_10680 [Phytomonospora endophytica]
MQITLHHRPDPRLMKRALRRMSRAQRGRLLLNAATLTACGIAALALDPGDGTGVETVARFAGPMLIGVGAFHVFLWVNVVASIGKAVAARLRTTEPVTYVLTDERLSAATPSEDSSVSWRLIGTITEYPDMWLLHRVDLPGHAWSLPKAAFVPDDAEEFRRFAAARRGVTS